MQFKSLYLVALCVAALGLPVLETGAMYRAVTWAALHHEVDPGAGPEVSVLAGKLRIEAGK